METIKQTNITNPKDIAEELDIEVPDPPQPKQPTIDEGEVKEFALIEIGSLKLQLGSCSIHSFALADKVMKMFNSIKKDLPKTNGGSSYLGWNLKQN